MAFPLLTIALGHGVRFLIGDFAIDLVTFGSGHGEEFLIGDFGIELVTFGLDHGKEFLIGDLEIDRVVGFESFEPLLPLHLPRDARRCHRHVGYLPPGGRVHQRQTEAWKGKIG